MPAASSSAMVSTVQHIARRINGPRPKRIENAPVKRNPIAIRRAVGALLPALRESILGEAKVGREFQQIAKWNNVSESIPTQLMLRDHERRLLNLERLVADLSRRLATACALTLCVLTGIEAYHAEAAGETGIERSLRSRRGKRRRDGSDDGALEACDHARAEWRVGVGAGMEVAA